MESSQKRIYKLFTHKEAVFRICCNAFETVTAEIIRQRRILEYFIHQHPDFLKSFLPVYVGLDAPEVAQRMAAAAARVGVGPMAAVAGTMAQLAAEAALKAGIDEVIIDNGGDIYLKLTSPAVIGIYAGQVDKLNRIAFSVRPEDTPLSICSSSGKMGHSTSLGRCDLAITVSRNGSLADAAATSTANLVRKLEDVDMALRHIFGIEGIDGVMIIQSGNIGLIGKLPPLVKTQAGANPFYA